MPSFSPTKGSWDPDRVIQCKPDPKLHGEYDPQKTAYNNSTLRAFNMLIETSNNKIPSSHLGTSENVLNYKPSFESNGHVARNIRLSLMAIDVVQPYVAITSVNRHALSDDIVPMLHLDNLESQISKIISVPESTKEVELTWTVGGAFTVDSTALHYSNLDNLPPTVNDYESTEAKDGVTNWSKRSAEKESFTSFKETLDISKYKAGESIFVMASAEVDQGWMTEPSGNVEPKLPPMSHIVNARTNPDWLHESAGKMIRGQKRWYSIPVTISIMENSAEVVELTNRFVIPDQHVDEPDFQEEEDDSSSNSLIIVIALSIAVTFTMYKVVNKFLRKYHVGRVKTSRSRDPSEFSFNDTFDDEIQLNEIS